MKQLQALQVSKEQSKRPRSSSKKVICWCCAEEGHVMRSCPVVQQNKATFEQKDNKGIVLKDTNGCQMFPESCPNVPNGANRHQKVSVRPKGYPRVVDGTHEYQLVPECIEVCQSGPIGTSMARRLGKASSECQIFPESCPNVPNSANRHQKVPICPRGYPRVTDDTYEYQLVPECAEMCQSGPNETIMVRGLSKAIIVTVSIAGVGVNALVDTGATISCCRWGWYKKWQYRLGDVEKSKKRIVGIGNDPIKTKGVTRPLTLHWDDVKGQCQLKILTCLTDVDVVLGTDVLTQFKAKINGGDLTARPGK